MNEYVERGPITEIAIQALESYKEAEAQNIWECSGHIMADIEELENAVADRINDVRSIPAADVRPVVRARWEDETGYVFSLLAQRVYCPVCKSYAYFCTITKKNFCPNCGADMRETGR